MTAEPSLDGFFPARILERLEPLDASTPFHARQARFDGAALFADISGFTELTETLVARGEEGLGKLSRLLDRAFGHYVQLVHDHGGEVVHFAGDALLAYWPAEDEASLTDAARSAVACSDQLQSAAVPLYEGVQPQLHIGVGCGGLWGARVGGDEYAHLVFGGAAVREAVRIGADAKGGESVHSQRTSEILEARVSRESGIPSSKNVPPIPPTLRGSHAARARLVPRVVLDRAGRDAIWSAELRHTTSVFVRLDDFDEDASDALDRIDTVTREVHDAIRPFSSSPGRWLIDDKGLVFVLVFGVPLNAHKDDRIRALRAGTAIHAALGRLRIPSSVGVATGKAFCGPMGAPSRREYVIIGRAMNLAARLMAAQRGLLYAGPTAGLEQEDITVEPTAPLHVKGFAGAIPAFVFHAREIRALGMTPLYGRTEERAVLGLALARLLAGTDGALIVEGEAGLGKSHLIVDFVARAKEAGVRTLVASSDAAEYAPAFSPWRSIFRQLLGSGPSDDAATVRRLAEEWFALHPDLAPFAPLLGAVLRIELPETDVTRHLEGPNRVERTVGFLAEVVEAAAGRPTLLVLEDCHWMDPDSWRLARATANLAGVLVTLTSRPIPLRPEEEPFRAHPRLVELTLRPLTEDAIAGIVKRCLDQRSVTGSLIASVHERSAGNPLLAMEYVYLLRESQRAVLQGGHWVLLGRDGHGPEGSTPVSVRALIAGRVDNLSAAQAMTLKAAAAIGGSFSNRLLQEILPPEVSADLTRILGDLSSHQLVEQGESGTRPGTYVFRHDLIREVVYDLMLHEHRRGLHTGIARALEARVAAGEAVEDARLARHWFDAGDLAQTMRYADAAATKALHAGAYREVIYFIDLCFKCAAANDGDGSASPPPPAARWLRELADAHHGLGDLALRRTDAMRALEAARSSAAPSRSAMVASTAFHLARELVTTALPRTGARGRLRADGDLPHFDLAKVYRHLVELAYFDNDGLGMLWGALHAVDSADRAGLLSDLSRAYAQLGGALGLARVPPLATLFLGKALDVARRASEPHAEAYAHMCRCLYLVGVARWDGVRESTAECQRLAELTRDPLTWGNAQTVRFWTHYYRGETSEAHHAATELRAHAARARHAQHEAWALRCLGLLAARATSQAQSPGAAIALLEEARGILARTRDANEQIETQGALALAHLRDANLDAAERAARQALAMASAVRHPTSHASLSGIVSSLEVVFAFRALHPGDREWEALGRAGIETLLRYQRVFTVAEPACAYWSGMARAHAGDARGAMADWRRGLKRAEALGMHPDAESLRQMMRTGLSVGAARPGA